MPAGGGRSVVVGSGSGLSEEPASGCKAGHAGHESSRLPSRAHLGSAVGVGDEVSVDRLGDLALEGSQRLLGALALVELASVIGPSLGVVADLGDRSDVERPVELAVASGVEPVTLPTSTGGGDSGAGL